jgi:hypothetical protein
MNRRGNPHDSMIKALATVLPPRAAVMVVGPLTSSRDIHFATDAAERDRLLRRNGEAVSALADRLRAQQDRPVVNPSVLVMDGWSLEDYRRFFLDVLGRFVHCAYFVRGWEYSEGVTAEFLLCRARGIECRDEDGAVISEVNAAALLRTAARQLRDAGMHFDWMAARAATFEAFPAVLSTVEDP